MKDSPERSVGTAKGPVAITESVVPRSARGSVGETPADGLEAARLIAHNITTSQLALDCTTEEEILILARALLAPKAEGRDDVLELLRDTLKETEASGQRISFALQQRIRAALKEKPHG